MEAYATGDFPLTHDERVLVLNVLRACDLGTLTHSLMAQYLHWASARRAVVAHTIETGAKQLALVGKDG